MHKPIKTAKFKRKLNGHIIYITCINNSPCTICPSDTSKGMNLKDWNSARQFTNITLNKKWMNKAIKLISNILFKI